MKIENGVVREIENGIFVFVVVKGLMWRAGGAGGWRGGWMSKVEGDDCIVCVLCVC